MTPVILDDAKLVVKRAGDQERLKYMRFRIKAVEI